MRIESLDTISVSSILDFQQDRLRWAYKWVENRVQRRVPTALSLGKMIHSAFETSLKADEGLITPAVALQRIIAKQELVLLTEYEQKAVIEAHALLEPLSFWKDQYPIEATLEIEEPFEFPVASGALFRGRPDRVSIIFGKVFHVQHKTLGAARSVGTYFTLAQRSMHELIYGRYLAKKYEDQGLEYGGTLYNVIRKLKYRSMKAIAKKTIDLWIVHGKLPKNYSLEQLMPFREILHAPSEFFAQGLVGINPALQQDAMEDMNWYAIEMDRTVDRYLNGRTIGSNRMLDANRYDKGIDPYTLVMMGEADLADDSLFMDREETYDGTNQMDDDGTDSGGVREAA